MFDGVGLVGFKSRRNNGPNGLVQLLWVGVVGLGSSD